MPKRFVLIKEYQIKENHKFPYIEPNVSCIGYFDGVHKGHQALIAKTVKEAKRLNVKPYLITFLPDPSDVVTGKKTDHINTFERRMELFEKFGIEGVIVIDFNKDIMALPEKNFSDKYLKKLNLKGLVCGFDFHYGFKGQGDFKSLKKDLKNYCPIYMVEEVTYYGKKVSSTRIKKILNKGNIKLANKLLGYEYK